MSRDIYAEYIEVAAKALKKAGKKKTVEAEHKRAMMLDMYEVGISFLFCVSRKKVLNDLSARIAKM